jgi:hypothetical protein
MRTIEAFGVGDGAHRGLSDWYPENEAALQRALDAHTAFDTGWYGSKHEIACARIWSSDGVTIRAEVSVSDDFDTNGTGRRSTTEWTLDAVSSAVDVAWEEADEDRASNQTYAGYSIHDSTGAWVETYIVNCGEHDVPTGDNYYWWGWQYDEKGDVGIPHPDIPLAAVAKFEEFANEQHYGSLRIGDWEIRSWNNAPEAHEDPNDYVGMGWVDSRGRP